mgnify:FL=1
MTDEQIKEMFGNQGDTYKYNGNVKDLENIGTSYATLIVDGIVYFNVQDTSWVPTSDKMEKI